MNLRWPFCSFCKAEIENPHFSMAIVAEHRPKFAALQIRVTSPYEWKILEWDEKPQTNNVVVTYFTSTTDQTKEIIKRTRSKLFTKKKCLCTKFLYPKIFRGIYVQNRTAFLKKECLIENCKFQDCEIYLYICKNTF